VPLEGATRGSLPEELVLLHLYQPTALRSDESRGARKSEFKKGFKAFSFSFSLSFSLFLVLGARG
jgi:hypothetical protein